MNSAPAAPPGPHAPARPGPGRSDGHRPQRPGRSPEPPAGSTDEVIRWIEDGYVSVPEALGLLGGERPRPAAARAAAGVAPGPGAQGVGVRQALGELDDLVGLPDVKEVVRELHAFAEVQRLRAGHGLRAEPAALHMIFRGNPGTGKTTVARILGRLFKEIGILGKGHVVEVSRADLVGEYIGHTAQKTREGVHRALGGVLFVDEAYALARGGEKDFGKEAIDTLVKEMEDHRDNLVLILAGYRAEMEWLLRTNPGLRSRFPIHLDFPDFGVDDLVAIAERMAAARQYRLDGEARLRLRHLLQAGAASGRLAGGNARLVRNLIERAVRRQAVRLLRQGEPRREDLMRLAAADLDAGWSG